MDRIFKIAVLGSSSVSRDSDDGRKAYSIGRSIATEGYVLLTGGCTGLPHAAVDGATSAGGLTVAVSPAKNRKEHDEVYGYPLDSFITLFTGMGTKGRNVVLIRSADACVFVGGGMGTLNEFTIAYTDLGSSGAIGVLAGSGGLSDEIPKLVSLEQREPRARFLVDPDPEALLDKIFLHLRDQKSGGR